MIILYQIDINRSQHINYNVEEIISSNLEIDNEFVRDIIYGVITYEDEIINIANKYMKNWDISRKKRGTSRNRFSTRKTQFSPRIPDRLTNYELL